MFTKLVHYTSEMAVLLYLLHHCIARSFGQLYAYYLLLLRTVSLWKFAVTLSQCYIVLACYFMIHSI